MQAAEILSIPEDKPDFLFPGDLDRAKEKYRELVKNWHPDRGDHDAKVLAHINRLYDITVSRIKAGTWQETGLIRLSCADGKSRSIRFRRKLPFELGEMVYGEGIIAYLISNEYADLFHAACRELGALKYRDAAMEKEMSRYFPVVVSRFETLDDRCVLVLQKSPDVFCLRDILELKAGKMPPTAVAWILNAVYNIACYLDFAKLSHNGITLDSVFISPRHHSAMLYGGWWYARPFGAHMNALPNSTKIFAAADTIHSKVADNRIDLKSIKALGRELLGDPTGMRLSADKDVPAPMTQFLRSPPSRYAQSDYDDWSNNALTASFGRRRFVPLEVSASDVFKE